MAAGRGVLLQRHGTTIWGSLQGQHPAQWSNDWTARHCLPRLGLRVTCFFALFSFPSLFPSKQKQTKQPRQERAEDRALWLNGAARQKALLIYFLFFWKKPKKNRNFFGIFSFPSFSPSAIPCPSLIFYNVSTYPITFLSLNYLLSAAIGWHFFYILGMANISASLVVEIVMVSSI